jgi:hypothetical protein
VIKSATEVADGEVSHRPYWFTESETLLLKLIEKRNTTLKSFMKSGSTETHELLKKARSNLKREKESKTRVATDLCRKMPTRRLP